MEWISVGKFQLLSLLFIDVNKRYYLDEVIYEAKLSNQDSAEILLEYGIGDALIYADSAEPKSIEEISRFGINIHACDSKQDIRGLCNSSN